MRHRSSSCLLLLTLVATTLAAAPPQDNGAKVTAPATAFELLKNSYAALQRKDYVTARTYSLVALKLEPKNQYAWSYLAAAYERLGQLPEAEETFRTLLAINPRHATAYLGLGLVHWRQGRMDEAIVDFRRQLEIAPRNRYVNSNLSRALANQGKWEEARPFAATAAELAPAEPSYWAFLATAQIKTGRIDEARQSFDRALALPHDAMLENDVAYYLADAGVDLDRSWKLISGALAATEPSLCEPESLSSGDQCTPQLRKIANLLDTAGWVLYRQGKLKEAEPYLQSSFGISPRGESELHMVILLAKSGRLEEAVKMFAEVRTHPNFGNADSSEAIRELASAAGGDAELDTLLDRAAPAVADAIPHAKAVVMVNGEGKVTGVGMPDPALPGVADAAKSLILPALAWPGYALRSVRSVELQRLGDRWSLAESYVGTTPPPPPCGGVTPQKLMLLTERRATGAQPGGCPADF